MACICLFLTTVFISRLTQKFNTKASSIFSSLNHLPEPFEISSYKEVRNIFLSPNIGLCPNQEVWGGVPVLLDFIDGEVEKELIKNTGNYTVCMSKGVAPSKKDCLVYSFGINFEWSFDEKAEDYGCQVFSFDPSMSVPFHHHSSKIIFYDKGLLNQAEYS
ncbi:hypothetical protein QYM36_015773 [Artemia franciscana]|uniref:Uncharacterized protein n=1 Tax=Artemia franciscana TaxID=6661 RepID=A0AA88KVT5_ARTSF|nr:hypothetical protein QYM36_015773 [Artemia franciscana]